MNDLILYLNGERRDAGALGDDLVRAVIVSLFTWRRALPDDPLPGFDRMGWWGDNFPQETGERIGSRLWLLSREKLTNAVPARAVEYAREALAWITADGIAEAVEVVAERQGLDRLALGVTLTRGDAAALNIRFADVWKFIDA